MQTEVTKFISISVKDIPTQLHIKILNNSLYTYQDMILKEHLCTSDNITEEAQKQGLMLTKQETDWLDKMQKEMNRKDAAYFRVVEF